MRAQAGPQGLVIANFGGGNGSREALGTAPGKHLLQRGVCWPQVWVGRIGLVQGERRD